MRKTKFKKSRWNYTEKLFTVNNFKYSPGFLMRVVPDVHSFAKDELGYDLNKPKQLESFLRKCFRCYWEDRMN
jgi:hypothetical protein